MKQILDKIISDTSMRWILLVTSIFIIGNTCYQSAHQKKEVKWVQEINVLINENKLFKGKIDSLQIELVKPNADSLTCKINSAK